MPVSGHTHRLDHEIAGTTLTVAAGLARFVIHGTRSALMYDRLQQSDL